MSETTASGAGGSAAPGWYTDPHDPSQLRWWSGEGWTEHTSGGSSQPSTQSAAPQAAQTGDPLPSRRALRDPATEASEAAEAALQAQQSAQAQQAAQAQAAAQAAAQAQAEAEQAAQVAAAQQAQFAQQQQAQALQAQEAAAQAAAAQQAQFAQQQQLAAQQAQFAAQQQAQQQAAPVLPPASQVAPPSVSSVTSPPAPTLPVQPKSFLEQAGYAPLDAVPADQAGWNPVAAQAAPQDAAPQDAAPQDASPQNVAPQEAAAQAPAPQQYAAPPPSAPVQPLEASAWDQAAQQANEYSGLAAAQNQWNQPAAQVPPAQPGWDAPPQAAPQPTDAMDSLFGGAPAAQPPYAAAEPAAAGWGLTPTGQDLEPSSRRAGIEETESQSAGSSTFWGWLIAISPILAAGAIGYVLASTGYVLSGWPIEAAVAAPYLLVLLFALADRAALINLGHSEPRSPGWALLSAPVYLIMRASETRREDGSGTLLTLVWFVSVLVAIGGFVGYGFLTGHALIAGLPS